MAQSLTLRMKGPHCEVKDREPSQGREGGKCVQDKKDVCIRRECHAGNEIRVCGEQSGTQTRYTFNLTGAPATGLRETATPAQTSTAHAETAEKELLQSTTWGRGEGPLHIKSFLDNYFQRTHTNIKDIYLEGLQSKLL